MKIQIGACNNDNCFFWEEGRCEMPSFNVHPQTGTMLDETRTFDYDHLTGRLTCKDCEEE